MTDQTSGQQQHDGEREPLTPLEAARYHFRLVQAFADRYGGDDPDTQLQAYMHAAGTRQWHAAQSAACMALVSLAEDMHRLVDHLAGPCERHAS